MQLCKSKVYRHNQVGNAAAEAVMELPYAIVQCRNKVVRVSILSMKRVQEVCSNLSLMREGIVQGKCPGLREGLPRPSKSFNIKRWGLHLSVRWHAFILPPIKEVLAFVADEGPFCKGTTSVCARSCCSASRLGTDDRVDIDGSVLQENLRGQR